MVKANELSRNKIKRLMSLDRKDLLRLLADEREVQESINQTDKGRGVNYLETSINARIFLSYARPDLELVNHLYDKLAADGFTPWMDVKSLLPGEKWRHAIQKAIKQSDFFLICLSNESVNRRGFLQKEIRIALDILDEMLDDDIYLIPVCLEECKVPQTLANLQCVNLFEADGYVRLKWLRKNKLLRKCRIVLIVTLENAGFIVFSTILYYH